MSHETHSGQQITAYALQMTQLTGLMEVGAAYLDLRHHYLAAKSKHDGAKGVEGPKGAVHSAT